MTTHDGSNLNVLANGKDNPDQEKYVVNNATEKESFINGTCNPSSESLDNIPPVDVVLSSESSVERKDLGDENFLKKGKLKSNQAASSIKIEAHNPLSDSVKLEACKEKPLKCEVKREEKTNLETVQGPNALSFSSVKTENDQTGPVEASEKYDPKFNCSEKNVNSMIFLEKNNESENTPLISVYERNGDLDSLERSDFLPQRNCDFICPEQDFAPNEESVGEKSRFSENDGDGKDEVSMKASPEQQWKIDRIKAVLKETPLDIYALQQLAEEDDGFVTDKLRQEVWPRLLLVHESKAPPLLTLEQAELHPSCSQVVMDVERTLKRFPPDISPERRRSLMDELIRVIMTVLQRNPPFNYYQGYHDVGITFLLVCGESTAVQLLEELSLTHLREFLQPTMERTQRWLTYIYPMIAAESPALYAHMDQSGVGTMFCLPWLITWYAHSLSQYRHVVRLYDFLLASPPLMPMYVAGVILLQREQQLLEVPCDMPMLHQALSSIPDNIPLEKIFKEARLLYKRHPPSSLSDEVDRYLLRQKQREEAERAERDRRAALRKRAAAGGGRAWWLPYSVMRSGGAWVRTAGAVAVVAVVLGLASLYFRPDNRLLLPVQWSTERPVPQPQ